MKDYFQNKLGQLKNEGLYRFLKEVESDQGAEVVFEGKKYLNFSSNNYLGLANHPKLKEEAIRAIQEYGTGSGASRLITGSMTLHHQLEKKIAEFKGTEAALVFNSGYHANIGIISSLVGKGDIIFSDGLNHASIIDGCRLSGAEIKIYRHGAVGHLEELLVDCSLNNVTPADSKPGSNFVKMDPGLKHSGMTLLRSAISDQQSLITTDSLFSMDGDLAPLPQIIQLAKQYNAWVLVDEAHATGVFGETGRGVVEHFGIPSDHPQLIQMGTLGKALGSFGAYVCGSKELIDYLINKARSFIYTTSLPPAVLAASLAALDLISHDHSYQEKLWENVKYFNSQSPIFPLIIGDAQKTMEVAQKLFEHGIWAHPIRPPTVPEGTSRIRFTLMASHTRKHLDQCLEAIHGCAKIKTT